MTRRLSSVVALLFLLALAALSCGEEDLFSPPDGDRPPGDVDWIWDDRPDGDASDGDVADGDEDGDEVPDGDLIDGDWSDGDEDGDEDGDWEDDGPLGPVLDVPEQISFGPGELNRTLTANLTLRNTGDETLRVTTIQYAADCTTEFGISTQLTGGLTIEPGLSGLVVLTYRMADIGADECSLLVSSNDPRRPTASIRVFSTYSGTPSVNVVPQSVQFGNWDILSEQSISRVVSFTHVAQPGSNAILTLGPFRFAGSAAPFFFEEGFDPDRVHLLKPGDSYYFSILFAPYEKGVSETQLLFETNDESLSGRAQGSVALSGRGVAAEMEADPLSLAFGVKPIGFYNELPLTLSNLGEATAYIQTIEIIGDPDGVFSYTLGSELTSPIPAGQDQVIQVGYEPANAQAHTATLRVTGSNFFGTNPIDISLSGTGVTPSWEVSTNHIAFGSVPTFTWETRTVTVLNTSTSPLVIQDLFLSGDSAFSLSQADLDLLPVELTPGDSSFAVRVTFSPVTRQMRTANLEITTDDELVPTRDVSISGQGVAPRLTITRADGADFDYELFFGMTRIGEEKTVDLVLGNSGPIDLEVTGIEVAPPDVLVFAASDAALTVPFGQTRQLRITYRPIRPPSTDSASLLFSTNDPDAHEVNIALGGAGIDPVLALSPETSQEEPFDFGKQQASQTASYGPRQFIVTNLGQGPLTVESVTLDEGFDEGFRLAFPDGPPPFDVDPDQVGFERFALDVYFEPRHSGLFSGRATLLSSDLSAPSVQLWFVAEGHDCPDGLHDPDNSGECWYACEYTEGGVEVCDGLDNNCNGLTDEGYDVGAPCMGTGVCGAGHIECHPTNNQFTVCSTDPGGSEYPDPPPAELCDGQDNNCDGRTDEGFSLGSPCVGAGTCGAGVLECDPADPTRAICSTEPGGSRDESEPEICDGLDNDCDGLTDEDFPDLGEPCEGIGECGTGVRVCHATNPTTTQCSTDIGGPDYQGIPEICDGLDNNCDGNTDEGLGLGQPCMAPGICGAGVIQCDPQGSGETLCSSGPGGSAYAGHPELCDGLDNNCNGLTDEDFELGQPCPALGACGPGVWECHPTRPQDRVCSTHPGGSADESSPELCDGVDNNCDGRTDEGFGVGDACNGVGECGVGVKECHPEDPTRVICSTDIGGSNYQGVDELCDGLDNNCNGLTDEDFHIGDPCQGQESHCVDGRLECASPTTVRCSTDEGGSNWPTPQEICDGLDNNCNGLTDEGFGVGEPCMSPGECGPGFLECDPHDVLAVICDSGPGGSQDQSVPELCDGLDNDCNWFTDEPFEIGEPCVGTGECGTGVWECAGLTSRRCSTDPGGSEDESKPELCNGLDDDCDGITDNGFNLGLYCIGVGACGAGIFECDPGNPERAICSTDIGGSNYQGVAETCNGIDDDCNGLTDEDFNVGQPCVGVGECGEGVLECSGPLSTRCSTDRGGSQDESIPELCDGLDNDCDGLTDEDFNIGAACIGIGACGAGVRECLDLHSAVCSTDIGGSAYPDPPPVELCDGIDNNCNGETDEGFDLGGLCPGTGVCGDGAWECAPDGDRQCSTHFGGSEWQGTPEVCDGQDNDCNGLTDEDFDLGGICAGTGICGEGVWECAFDGSRQCSTHFGGSEWEGVEEICNGLDDNCNGLTDEGFDLGQPCIGQGVCGIGVYECNIHGDRVCSTEPGGSNPQDGPEVCDGQDNNCNGLTDEGFGIGEPCVGLGECGEGVRECATLTTTRCSTEPGGSADESQEEICDGRDNNCNGQTDEGFGVGEPCMGEGECGPGTLECTLEGGLVCSTNPGGSLYPDPPPEELCDGLDNNCNGLTDEGLGVGEPCFGLGACADDAGTTECGPDYAVICSTSFGGSEWAGSEEICDTDPNTGEPIDNNCDGRANEEWEWGQPCAGTGECAPWIGTWICMGPHDRICSVNAFWHEDYMGTQELCNGLDDDCNGLTDETFPTLGQPCAGLGECSDGVYVCDPDYPMGVICSTDPGGPDYNGQPELCDGLDNNCNGLTDEDWNIGGICQGRGRCSNAFGTWKCETLTTRICSTDIPEHQDYAGQPEICNYMDDNCNGLTDEDWPNLGDFCVGAGDCGDGYIECNAQVDSSCQEDTYCSKDPVCGSQREGGIEVCNGIDDNCDGCIDGGFTHDPITCEPITCTGVGECGVGVLECETLYTTRCSTDPGGSEDQSMPELCDGLDNNCNGLTDEGFHLGTPCTGVGACGPGVWECDPNDPTRRICSTDIGGSEYPDPPPEEICDGLDNNCNGLTDEGFDLGEMCKGMGECGYGRRECNSIGGVRCSTEYGGSQYQGRNEVCDGLDNNCNGLIDEGFGIFDPETGESILCEGTGGCGFGIMECLNETTAICCADVGGSCYEPSPEVCDGFDNDCNGETDELWPELGQPCVGLGVCGVGVYECRSDGTGSQCSTDINGSDYMGGRELCNGLDDDCNGLTDEIFGVGNDHPCIGVGECGHGYYECDPTDPNMMRRICNVDIGGSNYAGTAEICDGLDNNCNGQIDEGFHIGELCDGIGECRIGVYECDGPHAYRCSTNPGGSMDDSVPEICDGKDNNCNGLTDEDFPGLGQPCMAPGLCGEGVLECESDYSLRCSTAFGGSQYEGSPEVCDGQDNNCDGRTDEHLEIGEPCCTIAGECGECGGPGAGGVWECFGLYDRRCSVGYGGSASQSEPEVCDGRDNNCNGLTDEGFGVGVPCEGEGVCGQGVLECTSTGSVVCSTNPGGSNSQARTELCDGLDNNCNGQTDEGFNIGAPCNGIGECGAGVIECATTTTTRCSSDLGGSAYGGTAEICDGLDNDCDGLTDEDFFTESTCIGLGECGVGVWVCTGPQTAVCSSQLPDHPDYDGSLEVCDGLDNDCNGETDEGFDVGEPCMGLGECGAGVIECGPNKQPICSTGPGGSASEVMPEVCDGRDNNCNGETDEGFFLGAPCMGMGECGEGFRECDCPLDNPLCGATRSRCSTDYGGSEYIGGEEICDYRDNNCNGLTDELWDLGAPCVGIGQCGAGVLECKYGHPDTVCSTDFGGSNYQGIPEVCDGIDNDCDGLTDEDFLVGEPCVGIGECGEGVYECSGLHSFRCSTDVGGSQAQDSQELCDGKDNNCNGATDEDFPTLGQTCFGEGNCGPGVWECAGPMSVRCSTDIGGSQYGGGPELCNGEDDNCNGLTDEDFKCDTTIDPTCSNGPYLGMPCEGIGECGTGVYECANLYELRCSHDIGGSLYDGKPEECNGLDDDCDGLTDEDFPLGDACTGIGECGVGVWECNPNDASGTICSTDINGSDYQGVAELCNYLDDDCDGFTDETWPSLGQPCNGDGGCEGAGGVGIVECRSDQSGDICSTSLGGSQHEGGGEELCDGTDTNCNGETDEGFNLGEACVGIGQCGAGVLECNALDRTRSWCSTMPGGSQSQATQEICDGIDNNCNGLTDEHWAMLGQPCAGIGECGTGVWECAGPYTTRCSTRIGGSEYPDPPPQELCNGLDDNCNGLTDEGYFLGSPCQGLGACGAGVLECATPTTTRCSTSYGGSEYSPSPEMCDGIDNNCNGLTDEGFDLGVPCMGIGICGAGVTECNSAGTGTRCSTMPGGSQSQAGSELCDGLDNNCNGLIDEGFGVFANPGQWTQTGCTDDSECAGNEICIDGQGICIVPVTCAGDGACGPGIMECATMQTARCSTKPGGSQYTDTPEYCNNQDDNCNGLTDENYFLSPPWPYCTEPESECGGPLGTSCMGIGECGVGQWECAADGTRTRCSTRAYDDGRGDGSRYFPQPEKCNGLDDNCNGLTDEGFNLGQPCPGMGVCEDGVIECATLTTTRCSTMPGGSQSQAGLELCDGLDNNCNGQTDEGFNLGAPCMGKGECGAGVRECAGPYQSQCSTDPGGSEYMPMPELCDGKDNNCNGLTDELWPEKGTVCVAPGHCGTGYWVCRDDLSGVRCSALENAEPELCDGLDNNCNGLTDEDFLVGTSCVGIGACGPGTIECATLTTTRCSSDIGGSEYGGSPEVCDGIDNNCNGLTDEDFKDEFGRYNSESHCGACNQTCSFANASARCHEGECVIDECLPGWYDLDDNPSNGCECEIAYSGAAVCGEAFEMPGGELRDISGGEQTTMSGQILDLSGEMWFTFFARDLEDTTCDRFHVKIGLQHNPSNAFKMDIYRGGCDAGSLACEYADQYSFATDSTVPAPLGECPCGPESGDIADGTPRTYINYCDDQSAHYYVRVRYAPTVVTPTCQNFVLRASNAR